MPSIFLNSYSSSSLNLLFLCILKTNVSFYIPWNCQDKRIKMKKSNFQGEGNWESLPNIYKKLAQLPDQCTMYAYIFYMHISLLWTKIIKNCYKVVKSQKLQTGKNRRREREEPWNCGTASWQAFNASINDSHLGLGSPRLGRSEGFRAPCHLFYDAFRPCKLARFPRKS